MAKAPKCFCSSPCTLQPPEQRAPAAWVGDVFDPLRLLQEPLWTIFFHFLPLLKASCRFSALCPGTGLNASGRLSSRAFQT